MGIYYKNEDIPRASTKKDLINTNTAYLIACRNQVNSEKKIFHCPYLNQNGLQMT